MSQTAEGSDVLAGSQMSLNLPGFMFEKKKKLSLSVVCRYGTESEPEPDAPPAEPAPSE